MGPKNLHTRFSADGLRMLAREKAKVLYKRVRKKVYCDFVRCLVIFNSVDETKWEKTRKYSLLLLTSGSSETLCICYKVRHSCHDWIPSWSTVLLWPTYLGRMGSLDIDIWILGCIKCLLIWVSFEWCSTIMTNLSTITRVLGYILVYHQIIIMYLTWIYTCAHA